MDWKRYIIALANSLQSLLRPEVDDIIRDEPRIHEIQEVAYMYMYIYIICMFVR